MKFFGRELELRELRKVRDVSFERSRFTVLTGRRRVGKTELSREAFDDGKTPYVNLPITRQPEVTLCAQLQEEAERVLNIGIHGTCTRFGDLFRELMILVHRRMTEAMPQVSGFIQEEIDRAKSYFEEHYNEEISIEQYAASRSMSTSWFNRSFRGTVGTSPMKYILEIRIRNAQTLLETTDYSVANIASMIGYDNPMYFSRMFRKAKGMSPAKYRKTYREKFLADIPNE